MFSGKELEERNRASREGIMFLSVNASLFYILSYFIPVTKIPVVPLEDVDIIQLTRDQLKCNSGCELLSQDPDSMTCYRNIVTETDVVTIEGHHYQCSLNIDLPQKISLKMEKIECQFSDEGSKLLIDNSCIAEFFIVETNQSFAGGRFYDSLLWCLLTTILGIMNHYLCLTSTLHFKCC